MSDAEDDRVVKNGNGRRSVSRSRSRSNHSRSYSRSPSPRNNKRSKGRYSRSRSRSNDRSRRRYSRSRSRSYDRRRRHSRSRTPEYSRGGSRRGYSGGSGGRFAKQQADNPDPSKCLGIFGMSLYTTEQQLGDYFSQWGKLAEVTVVYDRKSGRSRGFGFVYFENMEDAVTAKERAAGVELDGHKIRVDFSVTKRAHTPTPGIYMGRPTYARGGRGGGDYDRRRSPSPYRSRRSRSRSYSPRRAEE